ncbi:MAG: tRNA lysidine(34) synthetase TilS [Candidatus Gastranaerophilales bacterium]|nr:tRNA lysidine(34) synthetase TilS [Candidatus Gastranaerophilales bacterium]
MKKVFDEETILTKEFMKLSLPLKKRIVKNLLEENDFDYDKKRIEEVLAFIEENATSKAGKTFSLDKNHWLFTNNKVTEIIDESDYNTVFAEKTINMNGETILDEFNAVVKITNWEGEAPKTFPKDNENTIYADFSNIELPLTFRTRMFGDRIVPFGKKSPIKLKKYLNNKKLSKHEKSKVLLISSGQNVLWAINLGISNIIKVKGMPTHKVEFFYKEK